MGERVPPSDFPEYRRTHNFRAPCCLCGHIAQDGEYSEAALYIARDPEFLGEYVAGCSTQTCGYLSKRKVKLDLPIDHDPFYSSNRAFECKDRPSCRAVSCSRCFLHPQYQL